MEIIISVPGKWKNETELIDNPVQDNYKYEKNLLSESSGKKSFETVFLPYDDILMNAYIYSGEEYAKQEDINESKRFSFTVYLVGKAEKETDLQQLIKAGAALMRRGGLGIKVENSGIIHSAHDWIGFSKSIKQVSVFQAYIAITHIEDKITSFGLHLFGLPDVLATSLKLDTPVT